MYWMGLVFGVIVGLGVLYAGWSMIRKLSDDEGGWKP
jgi:hypothetical protein